MTTAREYTVGEHALVGQALVVDSKTGRLMRIHLTTPKEDWLAGIAAEALEEGDRVIVDPATRRVRKVPPPGDAA